MRRLEITFFAGILTLMAQASFAVAPGLIYATFEDAGAMTSAVQNTSTYNFNSLSLGANTSVNWSGVGTFDQLNVAAADQNGGASNSQYLADSSSTKLTLTSSSSYFGLWLSAADSSDVIDFYAKSGLLLGEFTTANLLKALSSTYDGNPNNGGDATEPFVYVNFYGVGTTAWSSVVIRTTGGTLDADNLASRVAGYSSTEGMVGTEFETISATKETAVAIANAPEPNPKMAALLIGGIGIIGSLFRRIRKAC
jgi:hypothetical protein